MLSTGRFARTDVFTRVCSFFLLLICCFPYLVHAEDPPTPPYGLSQPEAIGNFLNGNLPSFTPQSGNQENWTVEDAFPNIDFVDPVDMREYPGQNKMAVAGKNGQVWTFQNTPSVSSKTLFLDIRHIVRTAGDCGILGFIFHPEFGQSGSENRGYFYVFYRYTQEVERRDQLAYLRLSRFTVPDGSQIADPYSEYVLIQQYDRHEWHNGGSMFFGPTDKFLYLIIGDEGGANDEFNSSQQINKNFFGGILRLDIDRRGGSVSHPIRKQPVPSEDPPSGWPGTFSQGYFIPNDNPWLDSNGSILEEFWALGFRSPHRMWFDPPTGDIWVGDIGQGAREEISIIQKGDNAQWPYKEGFRDGSKPRPGNIIGQETPPLLDYPRSDGSSVIGGIVYRGSKWESTLGGKYIFSDNVVQSVWAVDYYNTGSNQKEVLTNIPFVTNNWKDGVSHIYTDQAGEVYILQLAGHIRAGGRIYKLATPSQTGGGPTAPPLLSQTGAFSDLNNLTPNSGIIPYQPNLAFWSDGALKKRWIALPNDGQHDSPEEKVLFSEEGAWIFPSGTVFIKHFDFPVDDSNPNITQKIETRFSVKGEDGQYYFLTYRWREDQSDADLVSSAQDRPITIQTPTGTRQQIWHYPGANECVTCHNSTAKQVLGVNTRQANGSLTYPQTGITANQLETMNHLNWFTAPLNELEIPSFPTVKGLDHPTASLEDRARSYLDVNCGYCHQPGALQTSFDLRYTVSLPRMRILNGSPGNNLGVSGARLLLPGDPDKSVIYLRTHSIEEGVMMPPLAKNKLDEEGTQLIHDWIESMGSNFDTQAPSVPTNLTVTSISATEVTLSWDASTDNVGVTGYQVFQSGNGRPIQITTTNQAIINGLFPSTTYLFAVSAYDAIGNISAQSAAVLVETDEETCTVPYNMALYQTTSQSSTDGNGLASLGVNGDISGTGGAAGPGASLAATTSESQPWWQVDLGRNANISEIELFNRTDCCQDRLKQFYLLVSEQPFGPSATLNSLLTDPNVSSQYVDGPLGNTAEIPLSATGRYVRLQLNNTDLLHFSEMRVFACPTTTGGNDPCEGTPSVSIDPAGPFSTDQGGPTAYS